MSRGGQTAVRVIVAPDRLKAWVRLDPRLAATQITRQQIAEALEAARILRTPAVEARAEQLHALMQSGSASAQDFLVAEGSGGVEPKDAQFHWAERLRPKVQPQETSRTARISHYDRNTIVTVSAGEVIGTLVPADPGRPGTDVCGHPVPIKQRPQQIGLKANVALDPDGRTVRATCNGRVVFQDHKLSVEPALDIQGDVDFSTGNIDASSDVTIRGSVKDLFRVKTSKSISIDGHVDAATLQADGDVTIRGGVHGHSKGTIKAGGCVEMRLCDAVAVEAGGRVVIQKECINSQVRAADQVILQAGRIIGGHVYARNGIEVQILGSPGAVKTLVAVGIPTAVVERGQRLVNAAEQRETAGQQIRDRVQPLLAEGPRLSLSQRARAAELMCQADRLEQEARQIRHRREELLGQAAPKGEPYVQVTARAYPGTTVVISGRAAVIGYEVRGPIRIMERKIEGLTHLIMVDQLSGSIQILPTVRSSHDLETQAAEFSQDREQAGAAT